MEKYRGNRTITVLGITVAITVFVTIWIVRIQLHYAGIPFSKAGYEQQIQAAEQRGRAEAKTEQKIPENEPSKSTPPGI